jgi:hypothetical protein
MWDKAIEVGWKVGGPSALVGFGLGTWAGWPKCEIAFKGVQQVMKCHNLWGDTLPNAWEVALGTGGLGALIFGVGASMIGALFPGFKQDLQIPDE